MSSDAAKEIGQLVFDMAETWNDPDQPLVDRVTDTCTAYQLDIVDSMRDEGFTAGILTDPEAQVEMLNQKGHTVGFILNGESEDKNDPEIIAFDATIAQNGEIHKRRLVKIWTGTASDISHQLRTEFGGDWNPSDILGAVDIFQD